MAADAADDEPVRPSPPLIATLHRCLRDPSLVAAFERRRPRSVTGGLVRPRWVLRRANEGGNEDGGGDEVTGGGVGCNLDATGGGGGGGAAYNLDATSGIKTNGAIDLADGARDATLGPSGANPGRPPDDTPTNAATTYNALPRRNYIDLRMQQNRRFADAQCSKCATLLSKLHPSDGRWKQRANALRSSLDEGLAACPTHEGLRRVEREFNGWMRGNGGSAAKMEAAKDGSISDIATQRENRRTSLAYGDNPTAHPLHPQKGAEGRARAALRDALAERAFLLGAGEDGAAEGGAKGEMQYPLLAEADEVPDGGGRRRKKDGRGRNGDSSGSGRGRNGDSSDSEADERSSSSSDSSRSRRRRRKRSKRKHRKHKKRGKRRRRHSEDGEDERGRKGERRRSHDGPRSRSPSRSTSASSRSSSYRRRKHRRKERKRRKRHRRRSRDERSSEEEGERSADMAGSER